MSRVLDPWLTLRPLTSYLADYKAVWNTEYREWFYVNIYTKKSTWEKPTEPVYPSDDSAPAGPPPGYSGGSSTYPSDTKNNPYDSNPNTESDAELARRLQAEEDARAGSSSGVRGNAQQDYQNTPMPSYSQQDLPPREQKKGFFGKLLGKTGGSSSSAPQQQYQEHKVTLLKAMPLKAMLLKDMRRNRDMGDMGEVTSNSQRKVAGVGYGWGGAALGLGGGLIGGMLLEDAIQDHDRDEYNQGYEDGADNGGGDFGGGDDGDFGGDF
ncbi:hypothetical protein DID88_006274 [Monilinia fructigena]|uniref:WW domain-containing protein n=1 Tax=Monilinia fructigena TaxID=38457 RepID=A0A395J3C4_9HELO|nr:hypothetical protein DID88_006274 [Monilinia fructigena]